VSSEVEGARRLRLKASETAGTLLVSLESASDGGSCRLEEAQGIPGAVSDLHSAGVGGHCSSAPRLVDTGIEELKAQWTAESPDPAADQGTPGRWPGRAGHQPDPEEPSPAQLASQEDPHSVLGVTRANSLVEIEHIFRL
jgi:hypothetical protein